MLYEMQAERLFGLFPEKGLRPTDFVLEPQQTAEGDAILIRHKPSGYYFKLLNGAVRQLSGALHPVVYPFYTPDTTGATPAPSQEVSKHPTSKWVGLLGNFEEWLAVLKQEGVLPDR